MSDNGGLQTTEFERLETWYRIISERDGTAERRVWQSRAPRTR